MFFSKIQHWFHYPRKICFYCAVRWVLQDDGYFDQHNIFCHLWIVYFSFHLAYVTIRIGNVVIYIKTEFFSILSEHLYFLNALQVASIYSRTWKALTNTEDFQINIFSLTHEWSLDGLLVLHFNLTQYDIRKQTSCCWF